MSSTAPLSLVNVTLDYPDGGSTTTALDRVSLTAHAGRLVSLVGPSGSGKSSLLATAATLVRPTGGQVLIDGTDTNGLKEKDLAALRRSKVGIIFQQPNLLPSLTAAEQLIISDHLRGKPARACQGRGAARRRRAVRQRGQAAAPALRRAAAAREHRTRPDGQPEGAAGG